MSSGILVAKMTPLPTIKSVGNALSSGLHEHTSVQAHRPDTQV